MNHLQLRELEGTRDRIADHVAELRRLLQVEAINTRDVIELRQARDDLRTASAALDSIGLRISRLRCDAAPCDRVDGICPKCDGGQA